MVSYLIALAFLLMVVVPAAVGTRSAWDGQVVFRRRRKPVRATHEASEVSGHERQIPSSGFPALNMPPLDSPVAFSAAAVADPAVTAIYAAGTRAAAPGRDQSGAPDQAASILEFSSHAAQSTGNIRSRPRVLVAPAAADSEPTSADRSQAGPNEDLRRVSIGEQSADWYRMSSADACMPAFAYIHVPAPPAAPARELQLPVARPSWHETVISEPSPVPFLVRENREQAPAGRPQQEPEYTPEPPEEGYPQLQPLYAAMGAMPQPQYFPVPYFVPAPYGYPYQTPAAPPYASMYPPQAAPQFAEQQQFGQPYGAPMGYGYPQAYGYPARYPMPQQQVASAYMVAQPWPQPVYAPQMYPSQAFGQPWPMPFYGYPGPAGYPGPPPAPPAPVAPPRQPEPGRSPSPPSFSRPPRRANRG